MKIQTPYYFIDEEKLLVNLDKINYIKKHSNAKFVLALKCFSTWSVFDLMSKYMDGTTSSSLYEAKLGHEKFGKEVHSYSVAYPREEILELKKFADKIIFNSISQLNIFYKDVKGLNLGLRVNPNISHSHFDLADPARKYSRLGVINKKDIMDNINKIKGLMFHFNCENDNVDNLEKSFNYIGKKYGNILKRLDWISFGGGIYFTKQGYNVTKFCKILKDFSQKYAVQIYLEPGESSITNSAELVTTVLDITHNKKDIAIIDASMEAHMLDLLIYNTPAKIETNKKNKYEYIVAGRSCLAGDVFGTYKFKKPLKVGDNIVISDAAGYTMVKKNWFNGLPMPSIVVKRLNGKIELIRSFEYKDFVNNLS
ncbi:MAG: carboxynorspermidine decarboxylase [Endomicrobiaceae bacterium]|nr:carboxynorspermidine decarboxylase [Endomicrobiaceae bacterium]MDD3054105.1 carboxynorspermidine decarboxylase [Endomicrobiaceae bacterium]MDD3923012.1 carboxynorspermidine decarboxylase [Endomicrobiaceae bacterium]